MSGLDGARLLAGTTSQDYRITYNYNDREECLDFADMEPHPWQHVFDFCARLINIGPVVGTSGHVIRRGEHAYTYRIHEAEFEEDPATLAFYDEDGDPVWSCLYFADGGGVIE